MPLDDPVGMLVNFTTRICSGLGCLVGDGLNALFLRSVRRSNVRGLPAPSHQSGEDQRLTECKRLVLEFATVYGYMTREVMSVDELEAKIDSGATADELAEEFVKRLGKIPGVVLGYRPNGQTSFEMKLPFSLRDRHAYLIGKSGSGKTNLIRGMLLQDAYYGRGVGVLAPEQELITEEILPSIPEERTDDVIYVNPADTKFPIAFNPLHCDPEEDKEQKVDDFVTIFKRAVGETGYRMDAILSETLYALVNRPGSTLEDIPRFLSRENPAFRNEVLRTADERTRLFFEESYPSMDRNAASPVITRINSFTRRESVRALLCQKGKSFNFRHAMDEGKILLFNLSDGILGEQASQLLGQIIISKIQLAAMSRADTPKALRHPFNLYLDEFQTFTGVAETSYEKILSRARKYNLGLVLAHQQTGQISPKLLKEIFGNVTTFIAFNVSHEDAVKLSGEYAYDVGAQVEYVEPGEFIRLRTGEAIGKIGKTVFPLNTVLLPTEPDPKKVNFIIARSRKNYSNGANWEENITPFDDRKQLPPPKDDSDDDDDTLDPAKVF